MRYHQASLAPVGCLPLDSIDSVFEAQRVCPLYIAWRRVRYGSSARAGIEDCLPDSVVRRVHADDVLSELQDPFRFLVVGYNCSKIVHCLAVLFCVCNSGKGIGPAIVLRDGDNIRPLLGICVSPH